MRILLAEDEKKVADIIVRGLKAERYAVDVHHDGQGAWEAANVYNYDLIILDLMLPGMTGTEILEKIRRKNQLVPILILTARDGMADKIKILRPARTTISPSRLPLPNCCCASKPCYGADRSTAPVCCAWVIWRLTACRKM
ncbi:MAG: response regulator [Limisphaerales bacterium]